MPLAGAGLRVRSSNDAQFQFQCVAVITRAVSTPLRGRTPSQPIRVCLIVAVAGARRPMSVQDLGNIGELIAALATVATLIYLSIQIRNNTKSDEFAAMDRITADVTEFSLHLLRDEKMQSVFTKYIFENVDFESLEAKEKFEVRLALQSVFIMGWRAYEAHQTGRLSDNGWHIMISLLRDSYFPSATVSSWFASYAHRYPEAFVNFVIDEFADAQKE